MSSTFPTCGTHHCVMYQRVTNGGFATAPVWVCPMCESALLPAEHPHVTVVHIVVGGRCSNCGAVCALCASTDEGEHPGRAGEGR